MDNESRAAKEEVIRAVEAEMKGNLASGWISLGGASLLSAVGIITYEWHRASNPTGWVHPSSPGDPLPANEQCWCS